MTREDYMEAHHHATESAIGLIHVFMMAENYDKVNEILTKCMDELDRITKLRFETITQPSYTCGSPDGCHCGGDVPAVRAGCYHYKKEA